MHTDLFPRPHQLPAAIADFVGREELLQSLIDRIVPFPQVVLVTGAVGTGKTTLAVQAAHRVANGHFPDGQLFVRLRGKTPNEVLGRFLQALGLSVPGDFAGRIRAYRDAVAHQSLLVVLDDATSVDQVRPLLPDAPGCAVLVTSRHALPLPNVVEVGVLEPAQAISLLERQIGPDRLAREPGRGEELAVATGFLPLALRIAGARLAARPHWPLALLLDRFRAPGGRLDALSHGGLCLRDRLADACADLSAPARRMLGLLAGVGELPRWAPVAAFGDRRGESAMDELVAAHLVGVVSDRYVLPDLVREHASGHPDVLGALERVLGGWLHLLDVAHAALHGGDFAGMSGDSPRCAVKDVAPRTDPLRWLESERESLCAAVSLAASAGLSEQAWEIAHRLVSLFEVNAGYDDWQRTHEIALAACEADRNARGVAAMWCSLGSLHLTRCHYDLAREVCESARETFEDLAYLPGLALAYRNLGIVNRASGDFAAARRWYQRSVAVFESVGDTVGQATALQNLAQVDLYEHDSAGALARLTAARQVCGGVGPTRVLAQINYRLGKLLAAEERRAEACEVLTDALALARAAGDRRGESFVLYVLGGNEFARGRAVEALGLLREAVAICEAAFDVVGAARARLDLARVHRSLGETELADEMESAARAVYAEFGLRSFQDDMIFQM